jgi:predicted component of type VI protein secretion system
LILRHAGVQRLEVLVAVMLARERRALADAEDSGCTELAAALATLPSGLLEMVADAVAALGHADA